MKSNNNKPLLRLKSDNVEYIESNKYKTKDFLKYIGAKYNELTVVDFTGYFQIGRKYKGKRQPNPYNYKAVHVKCSCGKEFITRWESLKADKLKSCGCIHKLYHPKGSFGQSIRGLFTRTVNRALKANKEFTLSQDEFTKIITSNCFYCGVEPLMKHTFKGCPEHILHNGIDRYDNNKGYTLENSRPCCFECNRAKGTLTPEQFYNYIDRLVNNWPVLKNSAKTVNPKSQDTAIPC